MGIHRERREAEAEPEAEDRRQEEEAVMECIMFIWYAMVATWGVAVYLKLWDIERRIK